MKIVVDLTSLNDNFSGIERYALNISLNLIKQDNTNRYVLLFKNEIHDDFKEYIDNKNIEVRVIKGKNKLFFNQVKLLFELMEIKADKYLFLAFPSPIFFRRKGIFNTIHDLTAFYYPETMNKKSMYYFKYSIINAIKVSERIITVSETSKRDIIKEFGNINISVIKNGISKVFTTFMYDENKNKYIKEKYNLPDSYIMSLGTLEPRKNLKILIEAYVEIKKKNIIKEKLVLVGRKGWKFDKLFKNLNIDDIKDDIVFTGFVDDEDLPYIYKNTELFVFPSIYEGFGIPVIEAMYMESKVIVSDIDVMDEVCGESVIKFKNQNIQSLLKNIISVIQNKDQYKSYDINKAIAESYNWTNESKKLIGIIGVQK